MTIPPKQRRSRSGTRIPRPRNTVRESKPQLSPEEKFIERGRTILTEWLSRIERAGSNRRVASKTAKGPDRTNHLPFGEEPDEWMRRSSYQFLKNAIKNEPTLIPDLLKQLDGKHKRGPKIDHQPFKQGLLLMYALPAMRPNSPGLANLRDDPSPALPKLLSTPQRRAELGDLMAYARRHKVPSKLFNAFWRYVGIAAIKARLTSRNLEPGFEPRRKKRKRSNIET